MLRTYFLCLIPLFVAVDPFGVMPMFLSITGPQPPQRRRRTVAIAMISAAILALAFFGIGKALLEFLNVQVSDFRIAGGFLLLVIAVREIFTPKSSSVGASGDDSGSEPALVPLAIPLIVGPAVLTTGLALTQSYGYGVTSLAFLSVLVMLLVMLVAAHWLLKHVRPGAWAALSKIVGILLAAIGVAFIRAGVHEQLIAWNLLEG